MLDYVLQWRYIRITKTSMSTLQRKTPINPGKGFQNRGGGFQRHQDRQTVALAEEVGEGHGSSFGYSKKRQARAAGQSDEVGEGVVLPFSKAKQARGAAFQDETGEGITKAWSKRSKAIEADYKSDRARKIPTLDDPSRFKWGGEVGEGVTAMPKAKALRNQAVMDSARGRPCLLQAPYTMHHDPLTTVACHGNWSTMEKGAGRKADDCYIVWGCFECHSWLDQGSAPAAEKQRVHALGMFRQMLAWEAMAVSETEPLKFRNAARWALDHLEAAEYDPRLVLAELDAQSSATRLELDTKTGAFVPVTRV